MFVLKFVWVFCFFVFEIGDLQTAGLFLLFSLFPLHGHVGMLDGARGYLGRVLAVFTSYKKAEKVKKAA